MQLQRVKWAGQLRPGGGLGEGCSGWGWVRGDARRFARGVLVAFTLVGGGLLVGSGVAGCGCGGGDRGGDPGVNVAGGGGGAGSARYSIYGLDALYRDVIQGVVCVKVLKEPEESKATGGEAGYPGAGQGQGQTNELVLSAGTGVVVDGEGHILTAHHGVKGAKSIKVVFGDDAQVLARVVGEDELSDLALLKLDSLPIMSLRPLSFRRDASSTLSVGEWVVAVGGGVGPTRILSAGVVSAMDGGGVGDVDGSGGLRIPLIRTDAVVEPGNSGGPLFDLNGEVVGIVSAKVVNRQGGSSTGFAFGVLSDGVQMVLSQLLNQGRVRRSVVGMSVRPLSVENGHKLGLDGSAVGKAMVTRVAPGTPAAEAGFRVGDVIRAYGGREVAYGDHLRWLVELSEPRVRVPVSVYRSGGVQVELELVPVERGN